MKFRTDYRGHAEILNLLKTDHFGSNGFFSGNERQKKPALPVCRASCAHFFKASSFWGVVPTRLIGSRFFYEVTMSGQIGMDLVNFLVWFIHSDIIATVRVTGRSGLTF